jgi:ferrous iron transport protein A
MAKIIIRDMETASCFYRLHPSNVPFRHRFPFHGDQWPRRGGPTHFPINYEIDNQSQMEAPPTSLDQLQLGARARISAIDWSLLAENDACRLRHFGFDEGVAVQPLHLGPFGRDPLAVRVGRMTVAIRRAHARAVSVIPEAA